MLHRRWAPGPAPSLRPGGAGLSQSELESGFPEPAWPPVPEPSPKNVLRHEPAWGAASLLAVWRGSFALWCYWKRFSRHLLPRVEHSEVSFLVRSGGASSRAAKARQVSTAQHLPLCCRPQSTERGPARVWAALSETSGLLRGSLPIPRNPGTWTHGMVYPGVMKAPGSLLKLQFRRCWLYRFWTDALQ